MFILFSLDLALQIHQCSVFLRQGQLRHQIRILVETVQRIATRRAIPFAAPSCNR